MKRKRKRVRQIKRWIDRGSLVQRTITFSVEGIDAIDAEVNNNPQWRNRSHLIETVVLDFIKGRGGAVDYDVEIDELQTEDVENAKSP